MAVGQLLPTGRNPLRIFSGLASSEPGYPRLLSPGGVGRVGAPEALCSGQKEHFCVYDADTSSAPLFSNALAATPCRLYFRCWPVSLFGEGCFLQRLS